MELLAGDRQIADCADFPHHISPFPASESLLVSNPVVTVVHSSDADGQNLPPQKLRPIRASARSLSGSQAKGLTPASIVDGTLDKLGILVNRVCGISGDASEYFPPPVKTEASDVAVNDFGDDGLLRLIAECSARIGSGTSEENEYPNCEGGLFEDEWSSSSGDDDSSGIKENTSRKRKRKLRKKIEDFFQSLVMKVMDKQEQMHKQLIEALERRERERIIREEAWKQQERERMKKAEEVRAQENARNLALISFIENMMGHKIETPQSLMAMVSPIENDGEKDSSNLAIQKDFNSDPTNRRWPDAEVQALIILRAALEQKFRAMGAKCSNIWDEISKGMTAMGYKRNARKCKEKWENINKYFRRSLGSGRRKRNENSKSCSYFNELYLLHKNEFVSSGNTSNQSDVENESKNSNG